MESLTKYFYGNMPTEVMHEIITGMQRALPEPSFEEIDHWLNCNNSQATVPEWYERVSEFKASR